ncbi:MAG: biotin carboxyl carrier protein [Rhodothermales bacterium]|jgi:biotin carboxyl carrier protein
MARETYQLQLGEDTTTLEVEGKLVFDENGALPLSVEPLGNNRFSVVYGGQSEVLLVEGRTADSVTVRTTSGVHVLHWKDPRAALLESLGFESGPEEANLDVHAPMPGLVLKVMVEVGQHVAVGDGLVVLEAMKMENELRSGAAGIVTAILVKEGDAVGKSAPLIQIGAHE